jgi:hypothetical protein
VRLIHNALFVAITISVLLSYGYVVKYTNSLKFLNWQEINYARGKLDIYGWIDQKFPKMKDTIRWCENPPGDIPAKLARFDPDLIWFDHAGKMRSFTTNCYYSNPPLDSIALDEVLEKARAEKLQFWISSPNHCTSEEDVVPKRKEEDEYKLGLRKLNNKIICNAQEILPNLYFFDYSDIN